MKKAFNYTRHISIRTEFIVIIIFFTLFPAIILNSFYYSRWNNFLKEEVTTYVTESTFNTGDVVEIVVKEIHLIWQQVVGLAVTLEYLYLPGEEYIPGQIQALLQSEETLRQLKRSFPYLSNIYVISIDGKTMTSSGTADFALLGQKEWINRSWHQEVPGFEIMINNADYADRYSQKGNRVISVLSKITPYGNQENALLILLDFDYEALVDRIGKIESGKGSKAIIYTDSGTVLFHPESGFLGRNIKEETSFDGIPSMFKNAVVKGDGVISVLHRIKGMGWIAVTVPQKELFVELNRKRHIFLFILLTLITVSISLSYLIGKRITRPLINILEGMRNIQKGDFSFHIPEQGNKEFIQLARSYHTMQSEIQTLLQQVALKERENTRAELLGLQSQITPHFLYNSMDVFRGIAYKKRIPEIAEMAEALGNILRYANRKSENSVSLQQELEHLHNYIHIQKIRFSSRFEYILNVEKHLFNARTLRFILQPIVENSFQYGIENLEKCGKLTVSAFVKNNDLFIYVIDNGPGIPEKKLEGIHNILESNTDSGNNNIGLTNVHNRLRLSYGPSYGIQIHSTHESGTTVIIRQPFETISVLPE